MIDIHHIDPAHDLIHCRLVNWSRYVSGRRGAISAQPMFRWAKTSRQWDIDPAIHNEIDTLDGHIIERAVSALPDKNRTAIRWAYVFSYIADNKVRRELACTRDGLVELVHVGRTMLANRLR